MGTSCTDKQNSRSKRDHPHAYGDKIFSSYYPVLCLGSSPRVWGQDFEIIENRYGGRIIPTRMGTRCAARCKCAHLEDHPHAYGDKFSTLSMLKALARSSPRVWGQVSSASFLQICYGIIPTRMGTSKCLSFDIRINKDHPHAYGDKNKYKHLCTSPFGSSPRVWGQVRVSDTRYHSFRIIPTRMGTRSRQRVPMYRKGDHPHAYGDKHICFSFLTF